MIRSSARTRGPLGPGEYVSNNDGSWSNEITTTTDDNQVIPTLWLKDGVPTKVGEDEAESLARASGLKFPQFDTQAEAEQFANDRESNWQNIKPENNGSVPALWTPTGEALAHGNYNDTHDLPPQIPAQDTAAAARLAGPDQRPYQ
jgi:hypothetical protein